MNEDVCSSKERYDRLYEKAIELFKEGSLSHESYNFACHALEEIVGKNILKEKTLLDPQVSKTKGAPKRLKSGIEKGRKRTSSGKVKKVLNDEVVDASTRMEKQ